MSEVVALIDRFFWIFLLFGGVIFTGFCVYIFFVSVKSTKFEDVYSAEKLQLLASLDPNAKKDKKQNATKAKKAKKPKKPKENKEESTTQQTVAESSEPEETVESVQTTESPINPEESDVSSKPSPSTETAATTPSNKKKANKKNKQAKKTVNEQSESATPPPEPIIESVTEPIHIVVETAPKQQSAPPKKEKTRTKRAAQREDITEIDEDKFINRVSGINDLETEYVKFIRQFVAQANADKYEIHGVQEQVFKLQSKLEDSVKTIQIKDNDLAKIKNELVTARNGIHDLGRLQKAVSDEKNKSEKLQKQLVQTESSLRAALAKPDNTEEVSNLKAQIVELQSAVQAASATKTLVDKLRAELAAAKKAATADASLNVKLAEFQKVADAAESAQAANAQLIANLEAENAKLKETNAKIDAELDTLHHELDALATGFQEKENLVHATNVATEETNRLQEKFDELSIKNENNNAAITKLNIELRKVYNEALENKTKLNEAEKKLEASNETNNDLNTRLETVGKKLADHEEYYRETSSRIRELHNEAQSLEKEKNDLKLQLREERQRVEELEKVETVAPVNAAPAEDTAAKEQIQKLQKELETSETAMKEYYEQTYSKIPDLEGAVDTLKYQKVELIELNIKLAAAVREAEEQAKNIASQAGDIESNTLKSAVESIGEALASVGVKTNPTVPSSTEGLSKWAQSIAGAVKKALTKSKEVTPTPVAVQPTTSSSASEEVEKLTDQLAVYEQNFETLLKQIDAIETAYNERKVEHKNELSAVQAQS